MRLFAYIKLFHLDFVIDVGDVELVYSLGKVLYEFSIRFLFCFFPVCIATARTTINKEKEEDKKFKKKKLARKTLET